MSNNSTQSPKHGTARGMRFATIALLLLFGATLWFAGNFYVVRTGDGVSLVKKTAFSLTNVMVSMQNLQRLSPEQIAEQCPDVLKALQADPRFAEEMRNLALQGVQEGVENVKGTVESGAATAAENVRTGAEAAKASLGNL